MKGKADPLSVKLSYHSFHVNTIGKLSPSHTMERLLRRRLGKSDVFEAFGLAEQLLPSQQLPIAKIVYDPQPQAPSCSLSGVQS